MVDVRAFSVGSLYWLVGCLILKPPWLVDFGGLVGWLIATISWLANVKGAFLGWLLLGWLMLKASWLLDFNSWHFRLVHVTGFSVG